MLQDMLVFNRKCVHFTNLLKAMFLNGTLMYLRSGCVTFPEAFHIL